MIIISITCGKIRWQCVYCMFIVKKETIRDDFVSRLLRITIGKMKGERERERIASDIIWYVHTHKTDIDQSLSKYFNLETTRFFPYCTVNLTMTQANAKIRQWDKQSTSTTDYHSTACRFRCAGRWSIFSSLPVSYFGHKRLMFSFSFLWSGYLLFSFS